MNEHLKQPAYVPERDGEMSIRLNDDASMTIRVEFASGEERWITLSLHNAFLAFALLSLMLGIKIPKRVARAIKIPFGRRAAERGAG